MLQFQINNSLNAADLGRKINIILPILPDQQLEKLPVVITGRKIMLLD
jgi:hypothetical protein